MASRTPDQRPRELRRRVVLPARMRVDSSWCDACILNISSRGLMVQVGRGAPDAEVVEVRRGDYVIRGRVVWREGTRAGLQCDERLPVDEILSLSQASSLQLTAAAGFVERRKEPRLDYERSRLRARLFEFAGVAMLIGTFTVGILAMVEQALARPMAMIEAALGG